ncbi:MAG: hypothetical protein RL095_1033 [Verrucomicrobiota bacterium]|jgi:dTDP-4-amino-4,6-dideoxygalactose transaminase
MLGTSLSPWPSYSEEEAALVSQVLLSNRVNYWTGRICRDFEADYAAHCQVPYAVACTNGTVALDLAWKGLGIGPGDEVIVSPRSFLASVSSIVNAGATPVFADIDRDSQNLCPRAAAAAITPRTRAILCIHLAGWPCDMDAFRALCDERKIWLVEDCAQSHGALWKGRPTGSFGDAAAFSFCQDKIITTGGEGGMLVTPHQKCWDIAWSYKDHGKSYEAMTTRVHPPGFRWVHESFGTNWRMIEIQAVLGRYQLARLDGMLSRREANARRIWAACEATGLLRVPQVPSHIRHACYKAYAFVRPERLKPGKTRQEMIEAINARGIPCQGGSCSEMYLEKAFDGTPWRPAERLPVAKELGETSLMFLCHPTLRDDEIERICAVITEVAAEFRV